MQVQSEQGKVWHAADMHHQEPHDMNRQLAENHDHWPTFTGLLMGLVIVATGLLVSCESTSSTPAPSGDVSADSSGQQQAQTESSNPTSTPASVASSEDDPGLVAFQQGMCAKCHGEDGKGSDRAPDLTDDMWLHCDGTVAGIREVLVTGVPKEKLIDTERPFAMNPVTNLVDESQLDALATYIKNLGAVN